jgi:hypothetical protein
MSMNLSLLLVLAATITASLILVAIYDLLSERLRATNATLIVAAILAIGLTIILTLAHRATTTPIHP